MKRISSFASFEQWQSDYRKALSAQASQDLRGLLSDMRARIAMEGDSAIYEYSQKFDNTELGYDLKVSPIRIEAAYEEVDDAYISALKTAAENIRAFHQNQLPENWELDRDGVRYGNRYTALESVGLYVPGGRAAYPSTVLMDAIPAVLAGVEQLVMVTPPSVTAPVLVAADLCGVKDIYLVGGAQAVFALADGTTSVPKVDKIVGPGNVYVTQAKQMVYGKVDIDKPAGPSEVLVYLEDVKYASFAAAEMLAQLEHDPLANAIVLAKPDVLTAVEAAFNQQLPTLKRQNVLSESVRFACFVEVESAEVAITYINHIASEHLSLILDDYQAVLDKVKHAGSIFCGPYTPVTLGDYYAGTNHVLPTEGTARFASPLGVMDFMKYSSFLSYDQSVLAQAKDDLKILTDAEGFDAHFNAVTQRL